MKKQTTLKTILILSVLAMMTACGQAKNDSGSDFSSRTNSTVTPTATSAATINCNQKSQNGVTAKLKIYTDTAGSVRNDYMNVMLTQVPAEFATGSYFEFFRWQATSATQKYLDPTPMQARFETLDGRILTNFSSVIYWAQVSQLAANSGMSDPNVFLKNVRLVVDVRDPQAQYDVLKVAMYNKSNVATVDMDMLMPSFAASPKDYANDNGAVRSSALQALHPFASLIGSANTATQYQGMAASYCF